MFTCIYTSVVAVFASLFDFPTRTYVKLLQFLRRNSVTALRADTTSVSASGDHATFAQ